MSLAIENNLFALENNGTLTKENNLFVIENKVFLFAIAKRLFAVENKVNILAIENSSLAVCAGPFLFYTCAIEQHTSCTW